MSSRAHLFLRIGAVVLLAGVTFWPRAHAAPRSRTAGVVVAHASR